MLNKTLLEQFFDKSFVLNGIEQISKHLLQRLMIINFPWLLKLKIFLNGCFYLSIIYLSNISSFSWKSTKELKPFDAYVILLYYKASCFFFQFYRGIYSYYFVTIFFHPKLVSEHMKISCVHIANLTELG